MVATPVEVTTIGRPMLKANHNNIPVWDNKSPSRFGSIAKV